MATPNTALNNILPSQATFGGKVLGTDGSNTSWVDPSGANKATDSVIGLTKLSCAAADPSIPIAIGDNDPRIPTSDEKAALDGTGTPSGANKFVTADAIAGFESTSNKSSTTTLGTSDTYYPTQNAVKTYVDAYSPTTTNGTTTKNTTDASTTQTIAHGLGRTPKRVRIVAIYQAAIATGAFRSETIYNGTTQSSLSTYGNGQANNSYITDTNFRIGTQITDSGEQRYQSGVVTVDETNISIAWTKTGSPTGTYTILWEAQ